MKRIKIFSLLITVLLASINYSCSGSNDGIVDDPTDDVQGEITTATLSDILTSTKSWWWTPLSDISAATLPDGYTVSDFGTDYKHSIYFKNNGVIEWYDYDIANRGASETKTVGNYTLNGSTLTINAPSAGIDVLANTFTASISELSTSEEYYIELHNSAWNVTIVLVPGTFDFE